MSDRPELVIATADWLDNEMVFRGEDKDRTVVEFTLGPVAAAILSLTLTPAIRNALAHQKLTNPEPEKRGVPDTPEGL